jgi:hypothetical protein
MNTLKEFIEKYGSDKNLSGYTELYNFVFQKIGRDKVKSFLEIGVGTLQPEIQSTFVGNLQHFPNYKPGNSLRAYRDYFPNAQVYGGDVAKDCEFEEDRIKSMIFDSTDLSDCNKTLNYLNFDVISDDGLHTAIGQLKTLTNLFDRVSYGGFYIVEDLGGGGDGLNMFVDLKEEVETIIGKHEYYFSGNALIIRKNFSGRKELSNPAEFFFIDKKSDLTIVTGLWNIGREGRSFDHYLECFSKFLELDQNLFIYVPKDLEEFVRERRSSHNTYIKIYELEDIKKLYEPYWDKTQNIRNNPEWYNLTGEYGWLKNSPQASLEWYNPIVMSKMFLLNDASIWNPFATDYHVWLDAGITNTVHDESLKKAVNKLTSHLDPFLFLSYPYETNTEIHGFTKEGMDRYASADVKYVCRGGLFGGHKDAIHKASGEYYALLHNTLSEGLMGTEESIFSIMSYLDPSTYRRYELDGNGLIIKFIEDVNNNTAKLVELKEQPKNIFTVNPNKLKVSLYVLTFNFPHQVEHTIKKWLQHPKWITNTRNILIDNSTNENARLENKKLCEKYGFEHIITNENTGINGGRFRAAQHFQESDSDYYIFLEDDMGIHPPLAPAETCRNGFMLWHPNLYDTVLKIMETTDLDFLKLSYTEVYMDNNIQVSWYNVPQHVRSAVWPNYDKLPVTGLDPNCPRTKFDKIEAVDGVSYATGEIYYCNWPMIVGKKGNKKMFLDTTWARPYEQTWMSHMFQETLAGKLKPAVLLASPINHERIAHYLPEDRREN